MGPAGDGTPNPQRRKTSIPEDTFFQSFKRFVPVESLIYKDTIVQAFRKQNAVQEGTFDPKTGSWSTSHPLLNRPPNRSRPHSNYPPPSYGDRGEGHGGSKHYGGPPGRPAYPGARSDYDVRPRHLPQPVSSPQRPQGHPQPLRLQMPPMAPVQPEIVPTSNMQTQPKWPHLPHPRLPGRDSPMQKLEEISKQFSSHSPGGNAQMNAPNLMQDQSTRASPLVQQRRPGDHFPFSENSRSFDIPMGHNNSLAGGDARNITSSSMSPVQSSQMRYRQQSPNRIDPRLNRTPQQQKSLLSSGASNVHSVSDSGPIMTQPNQSFLDSAQLYPGDSPKSQDIQLDPLNNLDDQSNLSKGLSVGKSPVMGAAISSNIATVSTSMVGASRLHPAGGLTTDNIISKQKSRSLDSVSAISSSNNKELEDSKMSSDSASNVDGNAENVEPPLGKPEFKIPTSMPPRYYTIKGKRRLSTELSPTVEQESFSYSDDNSLSLTDAEADAIIQSAAKPKPEVIKDQEIAQTIDASPSLEKSDTDMQKTDSCVTAEKNEKNSEVEEKDTGKKNDKVTIQDVREKTDVKTSDTNQVVTISDTPEIAVATSKEKEEDEKESIKSPMKEPLKRVDNVTENLEKGIKESKPEKLIKHVKDSKDSKTSKSVKDHSKKDKHDKTEKQKEQHKKKTSKGKDGKHHHSSDPTPHQRFVS